MPIDPRTIKDEHIGTPMRDGQFDRPKAQRPKADPVDPADAPASSPNDSDD